MQSVPFQRKTGRWVFLLAPPTPSPGEIAMVRVWVTIENCFFVCDSPVGELGVVGSHTSGVSLKSWGIRYVIQILYSFGRSWELGVPSWFYGSVPGMGFMMRVCLSFSYPFRYGYLLIHLVCRSHSVSFWLSLRELLCVQLYIWCFHRRREIQKTPMSPSWSLPFNWIEFDSKQFRIS